MFGSCMLVPPFASRLSYSIKSPEGKDRTRIEISPRDCEQRTMGGKMVDSLNWQDTRLGLCASLIIVHMLYIELNASRKNVPLHIIDLDRTF